MGGIVHIVNSDFGYGYNLAVHSLKIAEGLDRREDLVVLCRTAAAGARDFADVRRLGLGRTAGLALKALNRYVTRRVAYRQIESRFFEASLGRTLRRLPWDSISVVHAWNSFPSLLAAVKRQHPGILFVKDQTMATGDSPSDRAELRAEREVYDLFFSPSPFVSRSLEAGGVPAQRIVEIPYGVDPEEFRPRATGATASGAGFRAAFSGLLCARKGIPTLLEAWKSLRLPGASLHLYGRVDPPLSGLLREAAHHGIVVHGFVDLRSELPLNDLFVFPTRWEGSAKSVYEALACGLPVITTPQAGSVVQDGVQGFVVPSDDVTGLAAKIRFFYENPEERKRFSAAARAQGERYSWERYARSVLAAYHREVPRLS